jgi:hypothetical protein
MVHKCLDGVHRRAIADQASTGRSGQAMAAPTAFGRPWPMAPPVSVIRS